MLEGRTYRNDIIIGEAAMRLAVDSFGRDGAPDSQSVTMRAQTFYKWLMDERKSGY